MAKIAKKAEIKDVDKAPLPTMMHTLLSLYWAERRTHK